MTQRAVHRISGNSSESPKRPGIIYHLGDQALGTLANHVGDGNKDMEKQKI